MHARADSLQLGAETLIRLGRNILAVEDLGHLLERQVLCLDVEEIDDDDLEAEEGAVEDVVFPA
jgi:hypothetical protein